MKTRISIIGLFICAYSFGQKTTFYRDENDRKVVSEDKAKFKKTEYTENDTLVTQFIRISDNLLLKESKWKGEKPVGIWRTYDANGNKKSERDFRKLFYSKAPIPGIYENGEQNCLDCEKATFSGGESGMYQYIRTEIKYPAESRESGKSGTVYIRFIIEKDGTPVPYSILKGVDPFIDIEVWRLIEKMPKWNPAKKNGEPIESVFNLPVKFTLK